MVRQARQAIVHAAQRYFCSCLDVAVHHIAIAGWRTFAHDPLGPAMVVWTVALALNFSWSPIFFGLNQPVAAFSVIVALLAMIIIFIRLTWSQDALSALLFIPYAAWILFAAILNAVICRLNNPNRDVR
jgi:translocator protein